MGGFPRGRHSSADRLICLIIDTNEWRASQLLRDPVSASLIFALSRAGGRIGLPEVIEREVLKHGVALGIEAPERIEKGLRDIRALTDSRLP